MKRIFASALAAAGFSLLLAIPVAAQAAATHRYRAHVNGRLENQHDRISQGYKSHDLNKEQAYHLRAVDTRVRLQEDRDLARSNGHLTSSEDRSLNHELNRDSRAIYRAKH